jgi:hypothetical protein
MLGRLIADSDFGNFPTIDLSVTHAVLIVHAS